jgi:hypothetical protein
MIPLPGILRGCGGPVNPLRREVMQDVTSLTRGDLASQ